MVKTLRRKFIAITMISVTAVFLIIMGIINIVVGITVTIVIIIIFIII